jgi:nicotinate-nucleotide--dimethylbenzimidazole phosphoribosyltransferase
MPELQAERTLVKSPPELWAQLSDPSSLSRHLGEFGEIRITRVVPEQTVAWEGERASGTVELSASGWGTKVTLRARLADDPAVTAAAAPEEVGHAEPPHAEASQTPTGETRPAAFELLNSLSREPLPHAQEPTSDSEAEPVDGEEVAVAPIEPADAPVEADESTPEAGQADDSEPGAWFAETSGPAPAHPIDAPRATVGGQRDRRRGFFARLFSGRQTAMPSGVSQPNRSQPQDAASEHTNCLPAESAPEPEVEPATAPELESAPATTEPPATSDVELATIATEPRVAPNPDPEPVAPEPRVVPDPDPEPVAIEPPATEDPEPTPVESGSDPEPARVATETTQPLDPARAEAVLTGVLDDLGAARHRPFSRG